MLTIAMQVREALVALTSEGIVHGLPRRGFRVAQIRQCDVEDVFDVHAHVAGRLAALAAGRVTPRDLDVLQAIQAKIEGAHTATTSGGANAVREISQLNFAFHRTINRIPDADRLRWFLRAATRYVPTRFYEDVPGWVPTTLRDHPSIIDALQAGDGAEAERLTASHVARAGALVVDRLIAVGYWHDVDPMAVSGK